MTNQPISDCIFAPVFEKQYKQSYINTYFELAIKELFDKKLIPGPIYLGVGQSHIAAFLANTNGAERIMSIFPQHRCHSYGLSFGIKPFELMAEICGLEEGINNGKGGSASFASKQCGIYGHSGLLGDQVPIAVGFAEATKALTLCVLGDASCEEDYVLGALGYAVTKKCPILFVCEDNGLSILTKTEVRRSWDIVEVCKGFGMFTKNIDDSPLNLYKTFDQILSDSMFPTFVNIKTCRHLWHAGTGNDGQPAWDVYKTLDDYAKLLGIDYQNIKDTAQTEIDKCKSLVLEKLSATSL